jgi:hypothetical protein
MLAQRIQDALAEHLGPILAQTAVESSCATIGVLPKDLSTIHMFEFCSALSKRLAPFVGDEAAGRIANRVRSL